MMRVFFLLCVSLAQVAQGRRSSLMEGLVSMLEEELTIAREEVTMSRELEEMVYSFSYMEPPSPVVASFNLFDMDTKVTATPLCSDLKTGSTITLPPGTSTEDVTFAATTTLDPATVQLLLACDQGSTFKTVEQKPPYAYSGDFDASGKFVPYGTIDAVPAPALGSCTLSARTLPPPASGAYQLTIDFTIVEDITATTVTCA